MASHPCRTGESRPRHPSRGGETTRSLWDGRGDKGEPRAILTFEWSRRDDEQARSVSYGRGFGLFSMYLT